MAYNLQLLVNELGAVDWHARQEAVRRIEVAGDGAAVPHLLERLAEDDSPYVRASSARALGRLGGEHVVSALVDALDDGDFQVRMTALWALGEIGAQAAPALGKMADFEQSEVYFPHLDMGVAEVASLAIKRIENAVQAAAAQMEEVPESEE